MQLATTAHATMESTRIRVLVIPVSTVRTVKRTSTNVEASLVRIMGIVLTVSMILPVNVNPGGQVIYVNMTSTSVSYRVVGFKNVLRVKMTGNASTEKITTLVNVCQATEDATVKWISITVKTTPAQTTVHAKNFKITINAFVHQDTKVAIALWTLTNALKTRVETEVFVLT